MAKQKGELPSETIEAPPARPAAAPGPLRRYQVRLSGTPVLVVDAGGVQRRQEYLEVQASDEAGAWEQFKAYSGILASEVAPEIFLLPPEAPP